MATERHPYRINKGQYARFEEGEFRYYGARIAPDMDANNEVDLSDEEARRFGLHRLTRLTRRDTRAPAKEVLTPPANAGESDADQILADLMEMGDNAVGAAASRRFREAVIASGVLEDVPSKKDDILEALRSLTN